MAFEDSHGYKPAIEKYESKLKEHIFSKNAESLGKSWPKKAKIGQYRKDSEYGECLEFMRD